MSGAHRGQGAGNPRQPSGKGAIGVGMAKAIWAEMSQATLSPRHPLVHGDSRAAIDRAEVARA